MASKSWCAGWYVIPVSWVVALLLAACHDFAPVARRFDGGAVALPDAGGNGPTVPEGGAAVDWENLPGLALWFDAAVGVGTTGLPANPKVATWRDRSGKANDARQGEEGIRPRWMGGAVNGLPAVQFSGGEIHLAVDDAPSIQLDTDDFVVALVGMWINRTIQTEQSEAWGYILQKQSVDVPYSGFLMTANERSHETVGRLAFQVREGDGYLESSTRALNDGNFRLYLARRSRLPLLDVASLALRINAVDETSIVIPSEASASAPGANLFIGGSYDRKLAMYGAIAEIVMIRGTVDDQVVDELERYFNAKYALW